MSENNHEEEQRERCEEAKFVDQNFAELIQRVKSVMAIADELHSKDMIHEEKYAEIKAENTNQEKMRKLFESLNSGGDQVKRAFYYLLEKHQLFLFKDLGGVSRKRKPSEPECSVPCKRPNTESIKQDNAYYNNASMQAPRQAPTYMVTNIIHEQRPPCNMGIIPNKNEIVAKIERKPPAPKKKKPSVLKKEKNPPAPKKEKRTSTPKNEKKMPTPKAEKKTPALKTEKKTPAPKKEKKTPAPKEEKKTPAAKKEKKTPAPKEEKKTPAAKKEKKTPALKKEKKTPATKTEKKTPATKKAKKPRAPKKAKPPAPKKAKKSPAPKKAKKSPAPKKAKKPPAPKKAKKPPAPKKKKSAV